MLGRVGAGHARADRGPPVPQRPGPAAGRALLGRARPLPGRAGRAADGRRRGGGAGWPGSAIDSWARRLRAARRRHGGAAAATRGTTATRAPRPAIDDGAPRRSTRRGSTPVNGLQFLPFNTLYQLAAETGPRRPRSALLIPDLLGYWLTGRQVAEETNASTTGLLDARTGRLGRRSWSRRSACRAGLLPDGRPGRARCSARCHRRGRGPSSGSTQERAR